MLAIIDMGRSPEVQPFMQKPAATLDVAFALYGYLPDDNDPRWDFLSRYASLQSQDEFERINFANAWGATYLSDTPSYRSGYVTTINPENSLQLDRALDNLEHRRAVGERFEASGDDFCGLDLRLALTDSLTSNPKQPRRPVTPCPEALFQIQLYTAARYLGRVGFNIHTEQDKDVMSIVNIQGIPGGSQGYKAFFTEHGFSPFNLLVRRALAVATQDQPDYEVRGMLNPQRGNSQLYWGVFSEEGVEMYHAHRKVK